MSVFHPLRTFGENRYPSMMTRWLLLLTSLIASCAQGQPTPEACKALADPEAVLKRCYGGDLERGKYVGDLKCWPFSNPQRLRGIWLIDLEASEFFPNVNTLKDVRNRRSHVWLKSGLLDHRPELLAAAQGAGTRLYAVEMDGRQALCDGMFGHFGMSRRQVIAERFHTMRLLASSPS